MVSERLTVEELAVATEQPARQGDRYVMPSLVQMGENSPEGQEH